MRHKDTAIKSVSVKDDGDSWSYDIQREEIKSSAKKAESAFTISDAQTAKQEIIAVKDWKGQLRQRVNTGEYGDPKVIPQFFVQARQGEVDSARELAAEQYGMNSLNVSSVGFTGDIDITFESPLNIKKQLDHNPALISEQIEKSGKATRLFMICSMTSSRATRIR